MNVWPINALDGRIPAIDYIFLGVGMVVGWWFILQVNGSRSLRIMGFGTEEYASLLAVLLTFSAC